MTRRRFRAVLPAGYGVLLVAMITAMSGLEARIRQHIGSDHTAAASNIVRGQHEASRLHHAAERYLE